MGRNLKLIKNDLFNLKFNSDDVDQSVKQLIDLGSEAYDHISVLDSRLHSDFKQNGRGIEKLANSQYTENNFNSAKNKFIEMICQVGYPYIT